MTRLAENDYKIFRVKQMTSDAFWAELVYVAIKGWCDSVASFDQSKVVYVHHNWVGNWLHRQCLIYFAQAKYYIFLFLILLWLGRSLLRHMIKPDVGFDTRKFKLMYKRFCILDQGFEYSRKKYFIKCLLQNPTR